MRQVAHRATGYAVHVTMPEPVRHVDADLQRVELATVWICLLSLLFLINFQRVGVDLLVNLITRYVKYFSRAAGVDLET